MDLKAGYLGKCIKNRIVKSVWLGLRFILRDYELRGRKQQPYNCGAVGNTLETSQHVLHSRRFRLKAEQLQRHELLPHFTREKGESGSRWLSTGLSSPGRNRWKRCACRHIAAPASRQKRNGIDGKEEKPLQTG